MKLYIQITTSSSSSSSSSPSSSSSSSSSSSNMPSVRLLQGSRVRRQSGCFLRADNPTTGRTSPKDLLLFLTSLSNQEVFVL